MRAAPRTAAAQRRREEEARLQVLRHAEAERVRQEVAQRARLAQMALEQEHQRRLAVLRQNQHPRRLRWSLTATASLLMLGGTAIFWSFEDRAKQHEFAMAQLRRSYQEAHQALQLSQDKLAAQKARSPLPQEAQPTSAAQEANPFVEPPKQPKRPRRPSEPAPPVDLPPSPPPCADGDPLCPHL